HLAVFGQRDTAGVITGGLVPDAAVTYKSVRTGNWSDPTTWEHVGHAGDGTLPGADANVLVTTGTTVTVDHTFTDVSLRTVRDDGTLRFDPHPTTGLKVDTVIVEPGAAFTMGTAAERIDPQYTAKVIFADRGPIDLGWDPLQFSRGLVSHGSVSIFGSQ